MLKNYSILRGFRVAYCDYEIFLSIIDVSQTVSRAVRDFDIGCHSHRHPLGRRAWDAITRDEGTYRS